MAERRTMNVVLSLIAVVVFVGSGLTLAITSAPHGDSDIVVINGYEFVWEQIRDDPSVVRFEANGVTYGGVRISDLLNRTNLSAPDSYNYKLVSARDGYTKTVSWADLLNGFLVFDYEKRAVFPERKKQDWVDTVGEIIPVVNA